MSAARGPGRRRAWASTASPLPHTRVHSHSHSHSYSHSHSHPHTHATASRTALRTPQNTCPFSLCSEFSDSGSGSESDREGQASSSTAATGQEGGVRRKRAKKEKGIGIHSKPAAKRLEKALCSFGWGRWAEIREDAGTHAFFNICPVYDFLALPVYMTTAE